MTNKNTSLVTIGIPNYNYASYIEQALDSVVNQTYENIELIIVDDNSTDDSLSVIKNWVENYKGNKAIKLICNAENVGISKVSNIILNNAAGTYFQALDADDILLPGKIAAQVSLMENNKNAAIVYSNTGIINETGNLLNTDYLERIGYSNKKMPQGKVLEQLFDFNFIPNSSVLINTSYAKAVGGFDEGIQVQDYYLWLKLCEKYEVIFMPEITAHYRLHETSLSNKVSTNVNSIAGELALLYRYYKSGSLERKNKIKKNIHHSAAYLYQLKSPAAKYWLKKDMLLNPGLKTISYYLASKIGIPFSFINKIKSVLPG